jgi:hypothetical protein
VKASAISAASGPNVVMTGMNDSATAVKITHGIVSSIACV